MHSGWDGFCGSWRHNVIAQILAMLESEPSRSSRDRLGLSLNNAAKGYASRVSTPGKKTAQDERQELPPKGRLKSWLLVLVLVLVLPKMVSCVCVLLLLSSLWLQIALPVLTVSPIYSTASISLRWGDLYNAVHPHWRGLRWLVVHSSVVRCGGRGRRGGIRTYAGHTCTSVAVS